MKFKTVLLIVLFMILSACAAEPETVIETVVHESTVEIPQTVEVTRKVEVTVEVTRLVEVTHEVPVDVTRIVEVVITATPEPTHEPTPEPTATSTPVPVIDALPAPDISQVTSQATAPGVTGALLLASRNLRDSINSFRDGFAGGNCEEVVRNHDLILASPGFDVSGTPSEVQWSYGHYQVAVELAKDAALGIAQGCRDALANQTNFSITHLNSLDIQRKLSRALEELHPAIEILESLVGE